MSNPLATAFQAAAKVRPAIRETVDCGSGFEEWEDGEGYWIDDKIAERLIEAACWRELPGLTWEDCPGDSPTGYLGSSWYVILDSERRIVERGPTLAIALLAAVAGLGGAE